MGKVTEWESQYGDKTYAFSYEKVKGKQVIKVNGEATELKPTFWSRVLGFDEPFSFDGKDARLVVLDKKPDVAVDGMFLQSGTPYVKTPKWVIVFSALLLPLIFTGGAIGGAFAVVGSMVCLSVSRKPMPNLRKAILCLAVTVGVWIIVFIIAAAISG